MLRDLGVDYCEIEQPGQWTTMAAHWAHVQASNRVQKRFNYSSSVAELVANIMREGVKPDKEADTASVR